MLLVTRAGLAETKEKQQQIISMFVYCDFIYTKQHEVSEVNIGAGTLPIEFTSCACTLKLQDVKIYTEEIYECRINWICLCMWFLTLLFVPLPLCFLPFCVERIPSPASIFFPQENQETSPGSASS